MGFILLETRIEAIRLGVPTGLMLRYEAIGGPLSLIGVWLAISQCLSRSRSISCADAIITC